MYNLIDILSHPIWDGEGVVSMFLTNYAITIFNDWILQFKDLFVQVHKSLATIFLLKTTLHNVNIIS